MGVETRCKKKKKYLRIGRELVLGDKIGYVITKKGAKLYEKAQPYFEVTPDQVDTEYYVSSQVAPAAARILGIFGIGPDELVLRRQRSLLQLATAKFRHR